VSTHDTFEQRAASAGAALRTAFLEEGSTRTTKEGRAPMAAAGHPVRLGRATDRDRRPQRTLAAAAALVVLVVGVVSAGIVALSAPDDDLPDVLSPPSEREVAALSPPYLGGSGGTLPQQPVQSVQDFPVPFTFSTPPQDPDARAWRYYRNADLFDMGNGASGITVIAPTETYDPAVTWKGQTELVPAPTDGDGWAAWLGQTGQVDVSQRRELMIGGAPATRFTLDLGELPTGYEGCGGGRTCVALMPMLDPQVGPARVGTGPQTGLDDETPELTVIELEDRAVLVLTTGKPDSMDHWLPILRAVVDSLRFA
jgi:hypothetical protein